MRQRFLMASVLALLLSEASLFAQNEYKPKFFVGYSNLQAEGLPQKNDPENVLSPAFFDRRTTMHGFNGEATFPIQRFGVTADFSFNRDTQSSDVTNDATQSAKTDVLYLVAGPSIDFRNSSRLEPFVRAMGGVARTNFNVSSRSELSTGSLTNEFKTGSTDLAVMIGGGLDVRANDKVTIRVFQMDYAPIFLGDRAVSVFGQTGALRTVELEGQRQDHVRFSFGVTF